MSQEKIDKRKKSKADLLHSTKKSMRVTTIIISAILVVLGAFASVVCFNRGKDSGYSDGYSAGFSYAYTSIMSQQTTASDENTTTADGEKATTADSATTASDEGTTTEAE